MKGVKPKNCQLPFKMLISETYGFQYGYFLNTIPHPSTKYRFRKNGKEKYLLASRHYEYNDMVSFSKEYLN